MLGRSGREERGRINEIVGKTLLIAAASGCSPLSLSFSVSLVCSLPRFSSEGRWGMEKVWTLVETPIERLRPPRHPLLRY